METSTTDGLASSLMAMQLGKLQHEAGARIAAKAMQSTRRDGAPALPLLEVATRAMAAGQEALNKGIEGALKALDVYA